MAKISALPALALSDVDGTETLPVAKGNRTVRLPAAALVERLAIPHIEKAEREAARAGAFALVLQVAVAGWYPSETDPELLALADGKGGFVITDDGDFYSFTMVNRAPVRGATFLTGWSDRGKGMNLWQIAKGDGITDDTAAVQAVIDLASATGARINCGGRQFRYLIAGQHETLGWFPGDNHPNRIPFKRGVLRLRSNVHFYGTGSGKEGTGAKFLLSGGRTNPGSLFHHPFWEAPGSKLENVSFEGVELDGNLPNQIITAYPAYTHDNDIWQHGHGVTCFGVRDWVFERCAIHGFRGAGLNLGPAFGEAPGDPNRSRGVRVFHCTFFDNFSHDTGTALDDVEIAFNTFKDGVCDSRWVHAVSCEKIDPATPMNNIRIHHGVFDFRYGLRPPESTPQFASNSPEAAAGRRRYRRAVSFSFFYDGIPNNIYNGTMAGVEVSDNRIYQGSIDVFNWVGVDVSRNAITNFYEDFTGIAGVLNAISVNQAANGNSDTPNVIGLAGAVIRDNQINHDLDSYGIVVEAYSEISVGGGYVKKARKGGVRANGCSGSISDLDIVDVGQPDDSLPADLRGMFSSGVLVFGGGEKPLTIESIRATDTRAVPMMTHAVYANVAARPVCRVNFVTAQDMVRTPVRDVNNSVLQVGNVGYALDHYEPLPFRVGEIEAASAIVRGEMRIAPTTGGAELNLVSADGTARRISFFDTGGLEAQIQHLPDGGLQLMIFEDGAFVGVPLTLRNDGRPVLTASWQQPLVLSGAAGDVFLWASEGGVLRTKATPPTSDSDGTPVSVQS